MAKPRALLTGRNGFTGRYVARELEQAGYEVIGLSQRPDENTTTVIADLRDRNALKTAVVEANADVVLHLAAVSFVAHGDIDEIYGVNVIGTRNLLEALAGAPRRPELVVLASSANIYGNAEVEPISEDTPPAPANDYAVSKIAMEYMARLWMDRLPITITRPFNYTGVGQPEHFLIPKIVAHYRRGDRVIELGNTHIYRDFGDVRDVARAYAALVTHKPVGKVINLCTGIGSSLAEILQSMAKIAGYQIDVRTDSRLVRMNEVQRLIGSNARLLSYLGDGFTIHPFYETLEWMFDGAEDAGR